MSEKSHKNSVKNCRANTETIYTQEGQNHLPLGSVVSPTQGMWNHWILQPTLSHPISQVNSTRLWQMQKGPSLLLSVDGDSERRG